MKKYNWIVGIDPDIKKPGIAIFNTNTNRFVDVKSLYFEELFKELNQIRVTGSYIVILEFSQSYASWHGANQKTLINIGVGRGAGVIINDFLTRNNFEFTVVKPDGYSKYYIDEKDFKLHTSYEKKTNSDARAAAAIVWKNRIKYL
jgi:hypothetical protein